MKKTLLVFFFLLPALLSAEAFRVVIKTGLVQVDRGQGLQETSEGELIEESARLEIGASSILELARGGETLRFIRPGTYWLAGITSEKSRSRQAGLINLVWNKVATILQGSNERRQSSVGGVRAEKMPGPSLTWNEGETADLIEAGKKAFAEKRFDEAVRLFREAGKAAEEPEEKTEAAFNETVVLAALGRNEEGLRALEKKKASPTSVFYASFSLLRGRLLLEAYAYDEVLFEIKNLDFSSIDNDSASSLFLLLGLASLGKNDAETAKAAIKKAADLAPLSSATAKAAEDLLRTLPAKP